ncbi:Serine/threonine protein phosphatase [Pediococcus damnosus]|uniref:Serine/threonine protein phosphatase n=2 Tax=Pediococcus damnosus TaxID=51663 RepID=A0ABM6A6J5_9LACO|nr:metallophosphoesterase family protein [Pediococcus damnosus]AMV61444.1 Serine/threonine protein phosphatase [Pediococcus damnosus]AMV65807.1 Serine/threonine protein phosphatase [Pediococcus damnosus]AMV67948.1 Serine/threonine protein phosphatase [Pediococcus damnosus]AMV70144.1 Serine/threonine protein phosphatase [Pediococcus damnosus]KRN52510.1 serine threonine protein phosphatase [Pediococcus damnosus]
MTSIVHPNTVTIAVSDIHGNLAVFTKLNELITKYPEANLIFMGDYVDGHKQGYLVLQKIRTYQQTRPNQTIVLKGNHEQMLLDYMANPQDQLWLGNGGKATLKKWIYELTSRGYSIERDRLLVKEKNMDMLNWIDSLPIDYTLDNLYFVHAGLDWTRPNPFMTSIEDKLWIREEYIYKSPYNTNIFAHNFTDKTIITGHTPTVLIYGNYEDNSRPVFSNNFADQTMPCPIKKIQYSNEQARYFIDGGNHVGDSRIGNIAVFDQTNGELIDSYQD